MVVSMRPGHVIAACAIALLALGVVMVNSAMMRVGLVNAGEPIRAGVTPESIILSRSTAYMVLALVGLLIGAMLPIRRWATNGFGVLGTPKDVGEGRGVLFIGMLLLVAVCATVYVPAIERPINGSHRWIEIPVPGLGDALSMQPSEIAKWAVIPLIAWYAANMGTRLRGFFSGLVPALVCIAGLCAFLVIEDLGTAALIAMVASLMLLAGGARLWHFLLFVPVGLVAVAGAVITNPYRINRIIAFIDPYQDPKGIGYHIIQSLTAIANGGGFGRGLGNSLQKFGYLPEQETDFLFSIICEELGIAGAGMVIGLFIILIFTGLGIARRERDPLLKLWALGVVATVGIQAIINLMVVTGMAPTKGIALPLLSSGGTGWILTAVSLGVLIAIDRTHVETAPADLTDRVRGERPVPTNNAFGPVGSGGKGELATGLALARASRKPRLVAKHAEVLVEVNGTEALPQHNAGLTGSSEPDSSEKAEPKRAAQRSKPDTFGAGVDVKPAPVAVEVVHQESAQLDVTGEHAGADSDTTNDSRTAAA